MKPSFAHIFEPNNTGDANCSPKNFFSHWVDLPELDYHDVSIADPSPLIVGGGGMLHPRIDAWIHQISQARPVIIWGVGLNYHVKVPPPGWQNYLEHCKLVGLRDYPPLTGKFEFAPCPSCMSSVFNVPSAAPTKDLICYSHWQVPIAAPRGVNNFTNHREDTPTIQNFVETIAPYRYVLTNSYHGALWTIFAGRVPIVWRQNTSSSPLCPVFDGRFTLRFVTALPPEVPRVRKFSEVETLLKTTLSIHNPIAEHRAATMKFYYLVESYLARWGCI